MTRLVQCLVFVFIAAVAAAAQQPAPEQCPAGLVCITREAALKAVADADRVTALEAELKVKDEAVAGFREELNKMRVEFARVSGENSGLKQNAVQDRTIIEVLLKNARPKKFGLINLF